MGWMLVKGASDIDGNGGVLGTEIEGKPVAIYRFGNDFYATANVCTHQYALLSDGFVEVETGCVECPLHQGLFDIRTGKAQGGVVNKNIETYAVKVDDGEVYVDVDRPAEIEAPARPLRSESLAMEIEEDARRFVIVGGGQTAAVAARALRHSGFEGGIVVLSEEQHLPYERPPLSKEILLGRSGPHDTVLLDQPTAGELNVELRLGIRADALDTQRRLLTLSDASELSYDRLLIATGARPRRLAVPGVELPWVYELRTLDDALALKRALAPGKRLAVIGGGFIGLEVASVARELGCEVTLLEASQRLCERTLHPQAALRLHRKAVAHGVKIMTGANVVEIAPDGAQALLKLADGEPVAADAVVVGIGVVPNSEIAANAGIDTDVGIVVDEFGRTSAEDVYAAGDVALWPGKAKGPRRCLESWQNASEQAEAAARTMAGNDTAYDVVPWFWSDQFGSNVQILGLPSPDDEILPGNAAQGEVLYVHDGTTLTGVIAFDNPAAIRAAKPWLAARMSVSALQRHLDTGGGARKASMTRHITKTEGVAKSSSAVRGEQVRGEQMENLSQYYVWPEKGLSRIPDWAYTDPYIYELEIEKIFHGPTWNYVGLEAEIPKPGDFIRSNVGPTPVVVSRDEEGGINVFLNRCSHRAAEFCRDLRGNNKEFVCPYHQWAYDLKGNLTGVPFMRGSGGKGGMPKDFKACDHGPKKLAVTTRGGVIFASFRHDMEPLESYLGPKILKEFDATFDGRKLKVLGYYRNSLPGNWKLYHENLKDPYHATLLHTFLVSFGLLVAGNKSEMLCDDSGRHGVMASAKRDSKEVAEEDRKEMRAYRADFQLEAPHILDFAPEFDSPWSVTMMTVWPNLIVQREMNTLGVRQIVPAGPNEFVMNWTMFGFEGDDEAHERHRLRQGNLMGPAGFLGLEDNEAMKFVQDGMKRSLADEHLVAMDPNTEAGTADTLISESAIRAMYKHWREALGIG